MKSLYKIQEEYIELVDEIENADGELTEDTLERLKIHETELEKKMIGYNQVIATINGQIAAAESQLERLQQFKQMKENVIKRLKANMLQALLLFGEEDKKGIKRLEFGTLRLSTRRSKFVDIENEESIPEEYLKIDLSRLNSEEYLEIIRQFPYLKEHSKKKVSKTDIKEAIESGKKVEGASIETRYSLTIK